MTFMGSCLVNYLAPPTYSPSTPRLEGGAEFPLLKCHGYMEPYYPETNWPGLLVGRLFAGGLAGAFHPTQAGSLNIYLFVDQFSN